MIMPSCMLTAQGSSVFPPRTSEPSTVHTSLRSATFCAHSCTPPGEGREFCVILVTRVAWVTYEQVWVSSWQVILSFGFFFVPHFVQATLFLSWHSNPGPQQMCLGHAPFSVQSPSGISACLTFSLQFLHSSLAHLEQVLHFLQSSASVHCGPAPSVSHPLTPRSSEFFPSSLTFSLKLSSLPLLLQAFFFSSCLRHFEASPPESAPTSPPRAGLVTSSLHEASDAGRKPPNPAPSERERAMVVTGAISALKPRWHRLVTHTHLVSIAQQRSGMQSASVSHHSSQAASWATSTLKHPAMHRLI